MLDRLFGRKPPPNQHLVTPEMRMIDRMMGTKRRSWFDELKANVLTALIVWGVYLVLFGPLTLIVTLYLGKRRKWFTGEWLFASAISSVIVSLSVIHAASQGDGVTAVLVWLVASLVITPYGVYIVKYWKRIRRALVEPTNMTESYVEETEREHEQQEALSLGARERSIKESAPRRSGSINLGVIEETTLLPSDAPLFYDNGWLYILEKVLTEHMFILGATGAGKTEFLKRLIYEVLRNTDYDIYVIDGKGEEKFALDVANLIAQHRGVQVPIFAYGNTIKGSVFDAMRGESDYIEEQLKALIGLEGMEGNAQYYADFATNMLQLICGVNRPDIRPPRTFEEVRRRANRQWLQSRYKNTEEEPYIEQITDTLMDGFRTRILHLERSFKNYIDPAGFNLNDTRGAVFSINTIAKEQTAKTFLSFFVTAVKTWITTEKPLQRKALLLIDEFQSFGNKNITALLSQARTKNLGVVLLTQNTAGLGDDDTKGKIFGNSVVKIIMRNDDAEELARLAGTKQHLMVTVQGKQSDPTGMSSARFEDVFKVHPNKVAALRKGEFYAVYNRYVTKGHGQMVGEVGHDPRAIAYLPKPEPRATVTPVAQQPAPEPRPNPPEKVKRKINQALQPPQTPPDEPEII